MKRLSEMEKSKTKSKTEKEFESPDENFIVLTDIRNGDYFELVMDYLEVMSEAGGEGVYFTTSRQYRFISREMQKRNIKKNSVLFLDCISAMAGDRGSKSSVVIENPSDLEEISTELGKLLDRLGSDKKFIVIDSVSALLMYNSTNAVREFTIFLSEKLKKKGVKRMLAVIENEAPDPLKQILTSICDKSMYI